MERTPEFHAEKRKKVAKVIIIMLLIAIGGFCAFLIVDKAQTHRREVDAWILGWIDDYVSEEHPTDRFAMYRFYEQFDSLLNGELGYRKIDWYVLRYGKFVKFSPYGRENYLLFADGEPVCVLHDEFSADVYNMEQLRENKQPFAIVLVDIPKNKYPKDSNRYYYANTIGATYLYLADIGFSVLRVDDIAIDYEESVEVAEAYAAELTELAANGQLEVPLTEPTPERIIAR